MISEQSVFPDDIDPMSFFQDVDLDHKDQMDKYNSLIAEGDYTAAESYLLTTELHGYFAQLFNAFENRIYNTQDFLQEYEAKIDAESVESPFITTGDADTEPDELEDDNIWI